jgi:hypothetical protein
VNVQLRLGTPLAEVALTLADTIIVGDDEAVALLRDASAGLADTAPATAARLSAKALAAATAGSPAKAALTAETKLAINSRVELTRLVLAHDSARNAADSD